MSNESEIEYISGKAYIWRFDLTWFPSFNKAFVGAIGRNESGVTRFKEYNESCGLMVKGKQCVTDSCRFKRTIKDFIDLISLQSKSESITTIKDHPALYEDMIKFATMNLSEFDFDEIINEKYLNEKLDEFEIGIEDITT